MSRTMLRRPFAVRRIFVALVLLASSCARTAETAPHDIFEEALSISKELSPETDIDECRAAWKRLIDDTRAALDAERKNAADGQLSSDAAIRVMNEKLLINRSVTYISNKYWRDSVFTSALMMKRGNCLSTSLLYYLAGSELKLPVTLAFLPEHAFVRWDDGKNVINIETTDKGAPFTDKMAMDLFELQEADRKPNTYLCHLEPREIRAHLLANWSTVFFSLQNTARSDALLQQALDLCPENRGLRLFEARQFLFNGAIEKAEASYKKLLQLDNDSPWASNTAAMAYSQFLQARGRIDEAIKIVSDRMGSAPIHMKVNFLKQAGTLLRHKRNFPLAIQCHRQYALLKPGADAYDDLGSVLTEAHEGKEAIEAYEKALSYNPENFFTKVILAGLYERAGDKEKGRAYFAKIEKPRENQDIWYCALVWYYANISEEALMLENMEIALKADPSGHVYQYFVREPDLDPYRKAESFKKLMARFAPRTEPRKEPTPAGVAP